MEQPRLLIADRKSPALDRLVRALRKNKLRVELAHDLASAQARYAQAAPDVVLVSQSLPGSAAFALCQTLKAHDPAAVSLALVQSAKARGQAQRAGADEALVRPATAQTVEAAVRALRLVRALRVEKSHAGAPIFDPLTGFYAFEHFKQALFVEVKRAQRYKLPVALVLASIAAHGEEEDPELRRALMGGMALAVRGATRDTDLPVSYGAHNVMVLLPHTDAQGAEPVARRILFKIARSPLRHAGRRLKPRLSLSISASGDGTRPFSELVHEASVRLKEAEKRGGNCLVVA
jgi:two-component system cell cycle response regulator